MRKWIALCLALALMPALALGEELGFGLTTMSGGGETLTQLEESPAERAGEVTEGGLLARPLPIDFSPGMPPREECFDGYTLYDDPTLHIDIRYTERKGEGPYNVGYWVATVKIGDASQLRTMAAESFDIGNSYRPGPVIAEGCNAVLAVNGDYFGYHNEGIILRQGVLFRDRLNARRDVLLIDEDGDFHIVTSAPKKSIGDTVDGKKIINAFWFGPVLVNNGVLNTRYNKSWTQLAIDDAFDRVALCQIGPLEYKVIVTTGYRNHYVGMKLKTFATLCQEEGAITAYNLDGGNSTMLYFHGKKLNHPEEPKFRDITDIVYFASAWNPDAE